MGKKVQPQLTLSLDDGFLYIKTLHLHIGTLETKSTNFNSSAATTHPDRFPPPHYPINPRVFVWNCYTTADDGGICGSACSSEESLESYLSPKAVHSMLHSVYPEFKLPDMQICASKVKIQKPSKIKEFFKSVFKSFTCCVRSQSVSVDDSIADDSNADVQDITERADKRPTWASHKVGDVTTLHVLQGDKETYIGTTHAIRYLRRRNNY